MLLRSLENYLLITANGLLFTKQNPEIDRCWQLWQGVMSKLFDSGKTDAL